MHKMEMEWIVIADAHLGTQKNDVEQLVSFIQSLDPTYQKIIFLGDLFHIWAGPFKYHTPWVRCLLRELQRFDQSNGKTYFVVGNRDIFFSGAQPEAMGLPFTSIAGDFLHVQMAGKKVSLIHGDTVNSTDRRYLRWRKVVRHPLYKALFNLVPPSLFKKIMFGTERVLQRTNPKFRRFFPTQEWKRFLLQTANEYRSDLLIIGHFHPRKPIITKSEAITGIVVPDWHTEMRYLKIDQEGKYRFMKYQSATCWEESFSELRESNVDIKSVTALK